MKKLILVAMTMILMLGILAACGNGNADGEQVEEKKLVLGAKNFTEQFIISKITSIYLKEHGYEIDEKDNMASEVVRTALENGQVDLYWEYTGTGLVNYLEQDPIPNGEESFAAVKELDTENGIIWMNMADVNNTYTLMMREANAQELGIESISDLADYIKANPGKITIAADAEFSTRADGIPGVQDTYGFEFGSENIKRMDVGLFYQALRDAQVEVGTGFATDSRIKAFDLVNLEDDKEFFPAYNIAVTVRQEIYEKYPELEELLQPIADKLNDEVMTELNYLVDIEQENETDVARNWLIENELIDG